MTRPEPVGIVLMPPVGVMPSVLVVVGAKLARGRSRRVLRVQVCPYARMGRQELRQRRMVVAILRVVEQLGVIAEVGGDFRMVGEELSEPGVVDIRTLRFQPLPDVRMRLQKILQLSMLRAPTGIVEQPRILR